MTKPKSRTKVAPQSSVRKISKGKSRGQSTKSPVRPNTKHAQIIAMLRAPAGTTIAAITSATDWQKHSVRGFLAGVVRKKLDLNLASELTDKGRVYRIKDGKALPAASQARKAGGVM